MEIDQNQNTENEVPAEVEEIFKRVNKFMDEEAFDAALLELNKVESLERNADALHLRGIIKYMLKQLESAVEDLNRAEELNPQHGHELSVTGLNIILFRARAYMELHKMREAYVDVSLWNENTVDWFKWKEDKDLIEAELLKGHSMAEFNLMKLIDEGSFGKVHLATWNGKHVALKTPLKVSREAIVNEALTSMKFRHENIVSTLGLCNGKGDEVSIVMEYAEDGSLNHLLYKLKVKLTREQILIFARDVASGLAYLHKRSVIHRDLKSANILLFEQKTRAKIADFGQSRFLNDKSVARTVTGTFGFMAPEVLAEENYDEKADIYSFGVVLYEMCTNKTLPIMDKENRMHKIRGNVEDEDFRNMIMDCCKTDPNQRPSSQECLDRITVMLEVVQKQRQLAAGREQCRVKFKEFLPLWQVLDTSLKRSIVSMFLSLKYEGHGSELSSTIDTDELIPADFAFKKEFINIAKDIVANYPTDREKERQMEFAPRYIRDSSITPAQTVVENVSGLLSINVLLMGDDDDCKRVAYQFRQSDFKRVYSLNMYSTPADSIIELFGGRGLQLIRMPKYETKNYKEIPKPPKNWFSLYDHGVAHGPTYFNLVSSFIHTVIEDMRGPIHVVLVCCKNMDWRPTLWNITHHYMSQFAQVIAVHVVDSEGEDEDEQIRYPLPRELFSVSRYHRVRVQDRTTDGGVTLRASDLHNLARSIAEEASNWIQIYGQLYKENPKQFLKRLELPKELQREPRKYYKQFVLENSKESKCTVS